MLISISNITGCIMQMFYCQLSFLKKLEKQFSFILEAAIRRSSTR